MTETSQIEAAPSAAKPQLVQLTDIGIAPENLRASEPADADIPGLADTIKAAGLLYPLLVRPGRKGEQPFMALDGRRRLLALQSLVEAKRIAPDYGVKVEIARDRALQAAAIVVSNTQRAPVHVADVITAIGKLKSLKLTPGQDRRSPGLPRAGGEAVATAWPACLNAAAGGAQGRTNQPADRQAPRTGDRHRRCLKQFAQNAAAGYLYEHSIVHHLNGRPGLDDPMFDLIGVDRYRDAGGRIDADLFGEFDDVVLDPDKLQTLWTERVGVLVEVAKARGLQVYFQGGELYRGA